MHEIGVVRSVVKTVTDFAKENNIAEVAEIVLDIGELSLVIPKYVEDIYPVVVEDTFLKDTKLVLNVIPGMAECSLTSSSTRAIARTAAASKRPYFRVRISSSARSTYPRTENLTPMKTMGVFFRGERTLYLYGDYRCPVRKCLPPLRWKGIASRRRMRYY